MYLRPCLRWVQDPAVLSMRMHGGPLCLGHGLLGPGKSVQEGAQMKKIPPSSLRAGPYRYQPLTDNHALRAQLVRKNNMHLCLDDTDPNVIFYIGGIVELVVSPVWKLLQTENPKSPSSGLVSNN